MKLTKSLFMLCAAGLSLCACNSDEKELFPEGEGIVEVQIVPPTVATRATINGFTQDEADSLKVTGTYTVKLTATHGSATETWTVGQDNVKFTNVVGPKKVEVVVNGAIDANGGFEAMTLEEVNTDAMKDATKVPAYGETTSFTLDAATKTYSASVTMAIPVARLEVGAIDFTGSEFQKLQVAGVYLDNLRTVGGSYSANGFSANATPQIKDYYFKVSETKYGEDTDNAERAEEAKELPYVLGDEVSIDLATANTSSYYAYNFYGATPGSVEPNSTYSTDFDNNPHFKICFSAAQLNNEANAIPRYAMITKYKKDNDYIALENGKIYQVTAANLLDANIVDDEDGVAVAYELEVTVQEASWQIVPVTGEWQ